MMGAGQRHKHEWKRLCEAIQAPRKNANDNEILTRYGYYDPWAPIALSPPPVEIAVAETVTSLPDDPECQLSANGSQIDPDEALRRRRDEMLREVFGG